MIDNENEGGAEAVEDAVPGAEDEAGQQEVEGGEAGADGESEAEGEAEPKQAEDALPPLSVEEYQKRHAQVTQALKEERAEKRAFKAELAQIRAEIERTKTEAPQQFERHQLDTKLSEYAKVDWETWFKQNPGQAERGLAEFQALAARKEQFEKADQEQTQQQQQQEQQRALQELGSTLQSQEAEFRAQRPDYDDACEFLKADFAKEAKAKGFIGDQAATYVNNELLQVGQRVNAAGQDMAEFAYSLAVEKGYKPKQADIASIKAGEAATKTLSNVGGKSSNSGGSFEETMAGLNGAAAKNFWEKMKRDQHA